MRKKLIPIKNPNFITGAADKIWTKSATQHEIDKEKRHQEFAKELKEMAEGLRKMDALRFASLEGEKRISAMRPQQPKEPQP
jgi:hypothetical protein